MPAPNTSGIGKTMETLAEGFEYLKEEYCRLAHAYQTVQAKAAQVEDQCSSLRLLLSRNPPSDVVPEESLITPKPEHIPTKSLLEYLESNTLPAWQPFIARIKEAEFEAIKARPRCGVLDAPPSSSYETDRHQHRERDFTIPGRRTGTLGCPFVPGGAKPSNNGLPPTPRSSASHLRPFSRQSRRLPSVAHTTTRSTRPSLLSSAVSGEGQEGRQCPIRFLDSHSPEEIADFLKQNGDKLPRSHEVCIKRFEQNAGEMDAKYGDLPRLIEGIGRKHQSFMPYTAKMASRYADDGNEEDEEIEEDAEELEQASHRLVESWAKGLQSHENAIPEESESEDAEERVPHFDRPLREIRVGESPSRPWGVPIPSKYLDAPVKDEEISSHPAAPEDVLPRAANNPGPTSLPVKAPTAPAKPAGKCPFDHTAMAVMKKGPPVPDTQHKKAESGSPAAAPAALPKEIPEETHAATTRRTKEWRATVVNRGVAIVRSPGDLEKAGLLNEGTLLLGYGSEEAQRILTSLPSRSR